MWKRHNQYEKGYGYGGVVFVGSIFTGTGVGLLLGNVAAWALVGFGVGFVLMGVVAAIVDRQ